MGIETAKRGLSASQIGLNITGNNITNIGTEGYTRQRVDTVSMSSTGKGVRYAMSQASYSGQGVTVSGVGQVRDSFLDKRYRDELADVGFYDRASNIMKDIETALDEFSSSGLKDAMAGLSDALNDLSKSSDQSVNANIVLTAAKNVVSVLNNFDKKLNDIRDQQIYGLKIDVEDTNNILKRIADLNYSINQEVFASSIDTNAKNYGPNELMDERNLLLDKLSKYAGTEVDYNLDGTVKVTVNGRAAVDGTDYEPITLVRRADNTVTINWISNGESIHPDTGSLKASQDLINGRGAQAKDNETYDKGIRYFKDMIDSFAANLMTEFNNVLPVVLSSPGAEQEYKKLFTSGGSNNITAGNIAISDEWASKSSYIIDNFVASDGEFDNTYILKAVSLFNKKMGFQGLDGTFEEYINFYNTSEIGQQVAFYDGRLETANTVSDELLNQRDSVSAVSLDEEGVNLLQYQKAYNAMARLMTTLDEAIDVLINRTGLVGR
jgi:flagellar hook-associated protein 1 FlgK